MSLAAENWLWVHMALLMTGLAGLAVSVGSALMYLVQSAQIKSKHLGKIFFKLPSLDALDRIHFTYLTAGVIFFSLGLLSGIFWAKKLDEFGKIFRDPMAILSFVTAFFYWVIFMLRLSTLRRGQKIAAGTVLAFFLLIVTLLSSSLCPAGFHKGF